MKRCNLLSLAIALVLLSGVAALLHAQDAGKAPASDVVNAKPSKPQFFAGEVVEADAEHVKVSRNLLGRAPETRVFVLDGKTKTPKGGIKSKSRVTVRYEHLPEHDLALEIQVRSMSHTPKAS